VGLSLVTSLFRSEAHLPTYARHVLQVAERLRQASVPLEVVIVANDASSRERALVADLAVAAREARTAHVVASFVERETLYASWNRGVRAASGACVGFWNVDDVRTAEALIEGHRLIARGSAVAYFPFFLLRARRLLGGLQLRQPIRCPAPPFDRTRFRARMPTTAFFLFARPLYQRVGPFDERFRILGDFEWCVRASYAVDFTPGTTVAGFFLRHGANLSGIGDPLQPVEANVVHLRHGAWDNLRPVHGELMRAKWRELGDPGQSIPADVEHRLWGGGAGDWRRAWERAHRRERWSAALRVALRSLLDLPRLRIVRSRG